MKKLFSAMIVIFILIICFTQTSQALGLYSKPEFRGRVIDAETKQPIEGAVAVVLYDKWAMIGGPGGPSSYTFHAKETLTNNEGEFSLPSYSSLTLSSMDAGVRFIFYKPGFMAGYGPANISPLLEEAYFSTGNVGEEMEIAAKTFDKRSYIKWKGPVGIVELKKGESYPSIPSNYRSALLPLLFRAINEERSIRGHKGDIE